MILACFSLVGCAAQPKPAQTAVSAVGEHNYAPAAASALAFDSPIRPSYELLGLDRSAREAGAFIGYQDATIETFAVGVLDHQSNDPFDTTYDRWSYTEKVGVRYR